MQKNYIARFFTLCASTLIATTSIASLQQLPLSLDKKHNTAPNIVAVGAEAPGDFSQFVISTSKEGSTWSTQYFPAETQGRVEAIPSCITWGHNQYVAIYNLWTEITPRQYGYQAWAIRSPDGLTWNTDRRLVLNNKGMIRELIWANNQYIAASDNTLLTSSDGITWSPLTQLSFGNQSVNRITWSNNQYRISAPPFVYFSPDAKKWTVQKLPFSRGAEVSNILCFATSPTETCFAVANVSNEEYRNYSLVMRDGIWNAYPIDKDNTIYTYFRSIVYDERNKIFVIAGTGQFIYTSTDGMRWVKRYTGDQNGALYDIKVAKDQLIAVGYNFDFSDTSIITSPDGINWTKRRTGTSAKFFALDG